MLDTNNVTSEHVIIPRTENTIKCKYINHIMKFVCRSHVLDINSELDELDREEFYRLKKVSNKKQKDTAEADAEIVAARQKASEKEAPEATDVLGETEDTDVIF